MPQPIAIRRSLALRDRIIAAIPAGKRFEPLMTLYLTDHTSPAEINAAKASQFIKAVKYYPAGATTNSDFGVTDIRKCDLVFEAMQQVDMPLLLHGEVTDKDVDVFDREKVFIEKQLVPLKQRFPNLRVVLEHITTSDAVQFVLATNNIAATITPQHLLFNRNSLFKGGIRPHFYCLPILKREEYRQALLQAATSGNPKFFLGTDSAPHSATAKKIPVAARVVFQLYTRWSCMQKFLRALAHWINLKHSPVSMGQIFINSRAISNKLP